MSKINAKKKMVRTVTSNFHFDAAHQLKGYNGKCSNLHGHRWLVETTLIEPQFVNDENKDEVFTSLGLNNYPGIFFDFKDITKIFGEVINKFDHAYLNDELNINNPTAEIIADMLAIRLLDTVLGTWLITLKVFETPTDYVTIHIGA